MGHSTANSGAFRSKLAALRDWGLIARGDKDRVILSELAQHLVLEAPYHEDARQLLLAAFESCRVFGMLYGDSAKNTPLEEQRLRNVVVMRHGVSSDQADKFIESFIDSVVYAGLGKLDGNKLVLYPRDAAFRSEEPLGATDEADDIPGEDVRPAIRPSPVVEQIWETQQQERRLLAEAAREPAIPVAIRQAWPIDGGEIEFVIRTPKAMPPGIYALMAEMAEIAAKMERVLKPDAPASPSLDEFFSASGSTNPDGN
ncbi:hypothetical protein BCA37_26675 [Mycobacterium sp. djl-10]|nr:hypothetical protein BCA37_26675 [Mycobacterium sp. djl-10]